MIGLLLKNWFIFFKHFRINRRRFGAVAFVCFLVVSCQHRDQEVPSSDILPLQDYKSSSPGMMALPVHPLPLEDLRAFQPAAASWQIAGGALADYRAERYVRYESDHSLQVKEGTGVLVNLPTEDSRSDLYTELEHGDLELKMDILVPKGSNSGIYFQSRYELQILDSWRAGEPTYGSMGGIYQRWDESRPEGQEGYEGTAPSVNASLAPGLWQQLHVLFRAPRFDEEGNKTSNAKFEKVFLNGMLIHEDVELTGPTRGAVSEQETEEAPLRIQGSHGPVAFRNVGYKSYDSPDSLRLGPLEYTVYDYQGALLPKAEMFDTLTVLAEGVTDSLNVSQLSPRNERFAMWFSGELHVPVSGEYLFQTLMATGGNLYIDGELVTTDNGTSYFTLVGNIIHLEEGTHRLEISYFKRRYVNPLTLIYEGPGMERRTLASKAYGSGEEPVRDPIIIQPESGQPELIGGFARYGEKNQTYVNTLGHPGLNNIGMSDPETSKKRTHTLSVGNPEAIHYTFDLAHSSLLKFWRGPFADVTGLWRGPFGNALWGRGDLKIVVPLNAAVENKTGTPMAFLQGDELQIIQDVPNRLNEREYILNEAGRPVFKFEIDGVTMEDEISPSESSEGLRRLLRYQSDANRNDIVSIIARGKQIHRLPGDLYRVNNYYIHLDETGGQQASIFKKDGMQSLAVPVLRGSNRSEVHYRIIW